MNTQCVLLYHPFLCGVGEEIYLLVGRRKKGDRRIEGSINFITISLCLFIELCNVIIVCLVLQSGQGRQSEHCLYRPYRVYVSPRKVLKLFFYFIYLFAKSFIVILIPRKL